MPEHASFTGWLVRLAVPVTAVAGASWLMGYDLSLTLVLSLVAAGALLVWSASVILVDDEAVEWPDPTPKVPRQWFGLDLGVRRIANTLESATLPKASGEPVRELLREVVADRLVRRGADPADPFADAELPRDLAQALDSRSTRPISRRTFRALLRRIEEL